MSSNEEVLQELPNGAVRAALLKIIENNIPTPDYIIHKEKGSSKGDNYIGIVHRLSITYREDEQDSTTEPQKLGLFLKVPPDNLARREQFFARPCFLRESLIYDEYLPLLAEFQKSHGIIPEEDGFKEVSKCFKNLTDEFEEAVFMEDLSLKGFVMHDRFDSPSADLVKVVIRALGKLHALSFAIKDQWPQRFAKFKDIEEIFTQKKDDELFVNYFNSMSEMALDSLSKEEDKEDREMLNEYLKRGSFFDRMCQQVDGSRAEPYAVVCHGDCWNNNILFKFENGKPVDARLIDWQIARYASPVCDLMYYIFCCTTKPLRDVHYEDILDAYYTELSTFLQRLGSDPTVLFPRSALDDQLKKFGSFGLLMGLMVIPTITSKSEDVLDLDELSAKIEAGDADFAKEAMQKNVLNCSSRIRDVIIDLIKLGYVC